MIPPELLSPEMQLFIRQHELDDPRELVLKYNYLHSELIATIAEQIIGRRKVKDKIPTFYRTDNIIYPPAINLEQCSSEITASYKCAILGKELTQMSTFADLTGGLGVDSYFFSQIFNGVCYIEPNKELLEISRHNHQQLKANGIQYFNITAEDFLSASHLVFDCVYIDPSRRAKDNKKVSSLADCVPNVINLVNKIFDTTNLLLIKASPLLDIQQGIKELSFVKKVFVVSADNECKEILFLCDKGFEGEPSIVAINISKKIYVDSFSFYFSKEKEAKSSFSDPLTYLYEPNGSILKAGAFKSISERLKMHKLHPNTHLYTTDKLIKDFPGKVFKIVSQVRPDPKLLKKYFLDGKANVTIRNYPLSVKELKIKTGLKDGGDQFLIGFSGIEKKFLVVAEKVDLDIL